MRIRSPFVAMVWEIWQVTRTEVAWKLAIGIIGALAIHALGIAFSPPDNPQKYQAFSAWVSVDILLFLHLPGWISLAKQNGGRPGFPLRLLFTRPLRTSALVGVPMVCITAMSAMIYLLSALLLKVVTGHPVPLLPVAAWIAAFTVASMAVNWSARNLTVQVLPGMAIAATWLGLFNSHVSSRKDAGFDWHGSPASWPAVFELPLVFYAVVALIALVSFGLTTFFVSRQRRGAAQVAAPGARGSAWLVNQFRIPCPTASAARALVWFELKSRGLPLLTIALALAMVIPVLSAIGVRVDAAYADEIRAHLHCRNTDCYYARTFPVLLAIISMLIVLVLGSVNVFGLRLKRRLTYFEAIQPAGTPQLAGVKLLVRSACLMAAFLVLGLGIWTSMSILGDAIFVQMWEVPLRRVIDDSLTALTGYERLAFVVVASIGVIMWVSACAVRGALWTRYSRRMNLAASLLLLGGLALTLLLLAERYGRVSHVQVDAVFRGVGWIVSAAMILAIVYLFWSGFAVRALTACYVSISVVLSVAFVVAWITLQLADAGVGSAISAGSILSALLLPLLISVLTPWSFNRVRHM